MVIKLPQWFVFEQGDTVMLLPSGKRGIVMESLQLDIANHHQILRVKLRKEEKDLDNNSLELIKGMPKELAI